MDEKHNPEKVGSNSGSEEEGVDVSELFTAAASSEFDFAQDELLDSGFDDYELLVVEHPVDESSAYHGDVASSSAISDVTQPSSESLFLPQRTSRSPSKRHRPTQPTSDESDDPRDDPPVGMNDHHTAHRDSGMECNHRHLHSNKPSRKKKSIPKSRKTATLVDDHVTRKSRKRGASESSDADVEDNLTSVPFVPMPTIPEEPPETSTPVPQIKKSKSKCQVCKKKLGLTAITCRCGGVFCAKHRYDNEHDCSFDYRAMGAEEIRRNNPVVIAEKVSKL